MSLLQQMAVKPWPNAVYLRKVLISISLYPECNTFICACNKAV